MNPFETKTEELNSYFMDWNKMYPKPYNKKTVDAYTKVRLILMTGTEFEASWFMHQLARHTSNNDLRRTLAIVRSQEQQQQKRLAALKPKNENMLETTIAYEQLAVDLTAILAQREKDKNNIKALNFALLEDFDHLYRFANLLKMDYGVDADMLVGKFTEIMPARPTVAEHRYASDNIRKSLNAKKCDMFSNLSAGIITAAEQQTMNFYMNMANFYKNDYGRKLFAEIALIEEQHVSQYESLKDPTLSWLECWVMHEFTECYLYYSMYQDETDKKIKEIYGEHYEMEVAHLKCASQALEMYEHKTWKDVIPQPQFPPLLTFGKNKEYIRRVIAETVNWTSDKETYVEVDKLTKKSDFYRYQSVINAHIENAPSHQVIQKSIKKLGKDYRYQDKEHPIKDLRDRKSDNMEVGRIKEG